MNVERARLRATLKCGDKVWGKGTVFEKKDGSPIPSEIIAEIRAKSGLVEVLGPRKIALPEEEEEPVVEEAEVREEIEEESAESLEETEEEEPERARKKLSRAEVNRFTKIKLLDLVKNEPDFEGLKDLKRAYLLKIVMQRFL